MPVPPGRFGAVLTAMVTPFDEKGALDAEGCATLARWLVDNGSEGLVLAGTTGESPVLTDDEKLTLFRAVREAVTVPLLAGTSTYDTAHSVHLTKEATAAGMDGILAVTPPYSRPSQSGLAAHFRAIAEATTLPVLLYDIPKRTGREIATQTMVELARGTSNIVGVKDASGNPPGTAALLREVPQFEVYSGDDVYTLPLLAIGAVGTISVASHWNGVLQGQMVTAFTKGDVEEAQRIHARLIPSFAFETSDAAPNPIPTKAVLRVLGVPAGQCRLPIGPAPDGLEDQARGILDDLGPDAPKPRA